MSNPWTKKNPMMSMWLSAANRSAGVARGKASSAARRQIATTQAEAMRQIATAQAEAMRQILDFWTLQPAKPTRRKKARR